MKAKPWQTDTLAILRDSFFDAGVRHRAALLQLPTGLGKSLIAVRLFQTLAKRYSGLHLLIALPRKATFVPDGWSSALNDKLKVDPSWSPASCPTLKGSRLAFTTHHLLAKPTGEIKEWLTSRRLLLVVDECHKLGRIASSAADAFFDSGNAVGLPKWLARPRAGKPPLGPFVLLVSATPYNPVRLDFLDQLNDGTPADVDKHETDALLDELRIIQGFLGQCDRAHQQLGAVERYRESVGKILQELSNYSPKSPLAVAPKSPLAVAPRITDHLKPRKPKDHTVKIPKADVAEAVGQVANVHASLHYVKDCNRAVVERLALAGIRCAPGSHSVLGLPGYSSLTRKGLKAVSKAGVEVTIKLESLATLIMSIRKCGGKVVVFCTFRASAHSVANYLRLRLDTKEAVYDSTKEAVSKIEKFKICNSAPHILVATDRLSESIDLHHDPAARFLVHFELPWSPLRVLQRFGRLWRIPHRQSSTAIRLPAAPHVFHVMHPGSVEEEIFHRLKRRWSYLSAIGLGAVSKEVALGERVPRVPADWQQVSHAGYQAV